MVDPQPEDCVSNVFSPGPGAPRLARQWADPVLASWGVDGTMPDVVVAVSELMTNAITHGFGDVRLRLLRLEDCVRIEVQDHGPGQVTLSLPPSDALGGRGMHIVAAMARDWGVSQHRGGGKTVWAEFSLTR